MKNQPFALLVKGCVLAAAIATSLVSTQTLAQPFHYDQSTIDLNVSSAGIRLSPGETFSFRLPHRMFVHKIMLQVDSVNGNSGAEVIVNGDRKANIWLQSADPLWVATIESETASIEIAGLQAQLGAQGRFLIKNARAVVSDTDWVVSNVTPSHPEFCRSCDNISFPIYYTTVMGNVSNRAIILVDRLAEYANYRDYGTYLLPVKKAAAEARALAEARGDASQYARPYYFKLQASLDRCELYFADTFERNAAFGLATELLSLREHIRDILD